MYAVNGLDSVEIISRCIQLCNSRFSASDRCKDVQQVIDVKRCVLKSQPQFLFKQANKGIQHLYHCIQYLVVIPHTIIQRIRTGALKSIKEIVACLLYIEMLSTVYVLFIISTNACTGIFSMKLVYCVKSNSGMLYIL